MSKTILIVDDEKMITSTLSTLIKVTLKHNVAAYNDPIQALQSDALVQRNVDMIISDFMMPGMNGIEFLQSARQQNPDAVAILLTGYADKENAIKSINEVGLYYYLEKPWNNNALLKIIQNGLEKKALTDDLRKRYEEVQESHREIDRLYQLLKSDYQQEVDNVKNLIVTLANVIEAKDAYTDGHTRRVGNLSRLLGEKLGMPAEQLQNLEIAGIIHDIGKVGVSETILNKPGKLTEEEFEVMRKHTVMGENICKPLNCLRNCLDPVRHHHEKLNGTGYPDGLRDEEISLEARILAVADIFDALYSKRPYRDKLPLEKVMQILQDEVNSGCLDTRVVQALKELLDENRLDEI